MDRKIIHLDMDAFFAAIEERDNPALRGKPVIVGAAPGTRGVVSTCNYEARKYGVRSAMSSAEAYRRCPGGVFVPCHFSKYAEASRQVHAIMSSYTDQIEFLSLDEGYMDVTGSERIFGPAEEMARTIQRRVLETVGTTCSVGVGYNMLTAKLASEEKKPRGFFVIHSPEEFADLMRARPVGVLYGIGKKTGERLMRMGIRTVGDLAAAPAVRLAVFGTLGQEIQNHARGIDRREVTPNAPPKSIGKETTFLQDITDPSVLSDTLLLLSRQVSDRLKLKKLWGRTVTLKVKFSDMQSITRSHSGRLVSSAEDIFEAASALLTQTRLDRPVRLIGVTAGNLTESGYEQLSFADLAGPDRKKEQKLDAVVMDLRQTYGRDKLKTAKEMLAERHLNAEYKRGMVKSSVDAKAEPKPPGKE